MAGFEQRMDDELASLTNKWSQEAEAQGYSAFDSVPVVARPLLNNAANMAAIAIVAIKVQRAGDQVRQMTYRRVGWEGMTEAEEQAIATRGRQIFDRLWSVLRDELQECVKEEG